MGQMLVIGGDHDECPCHEVLFPGKCGWCESETVVVPDNVEPNLQAIEAALARAKELAERRCACHGMYISMCPGEGTVA